MNEEKREKLTEMIEEFCDKHLTDEYMELSMNVVEEMAGSKNPYYERGNLEVWASAVIYAVCQINSVFDESNDPHITRKDILDHFNTKQSVVSKKAINLRNIYNLDRKVSLEKTDNSQFSDLEDIIYENISKNDFGDSYEMLNNSDMSVDDYERELNTIREKFGEEYFKQNEGDFWLIHETRPFMQLLFEQSQLLWERGEKERAINQYKYLLRLNPNDNQGVRDVLFPNLLELNRLDEAQELYLQYEEDASANWKFSKLLLDMKNNAPTDEIKMQYDLCVNSNPYVVPFLLGKRLPDNIPLFYGIGDENEAVFYVLLSMDAWFGDKKAMRLLKKLSKK